MKNKELKELIDIYVSKKFKWEVIDRNLEPEEQDFIDSLYDLIKKLNTYGSTLFTLDDYSIKTYDVSFKNYQLRISLYYVGHIYIIFVTITKSTPGYFLLER